MTTGGHSIFLPENERLIGETNYSNWAWRMTSILQQLDLWDLVHTAPTGSSTSTSSTAGGSTATSAGASTSSTLAPTPDLVKRKIKTKVKKNALRLKFSTLKMKAEATIFDYIHQVTELTNEMADYGETLDDDMIVTQVLNGLPSMYSNIASIISGEKDTPTLFELAARLQQEEDRLKTVEGDGEVDALYVRFRRILHDRRNQRKTKQQCHSCGMFGHWARDCKSFPTQSNPDHSSKQKAYSIQDTDPSDTSTVNKDIELHEVTDADLEEAIAALALADEDDSWIIDSGATAHITGNRGKLDNFRPSAAPTARVRSAGGHTHDVKGKGNFVFQFDDEIKQFEDVYYVPGIKKNLLSVGGLTDQCNIAVFDSKNCMILKKGQPGVVVARGIRTRKSGLYRLVNTTVEVNVAKKVGSQHLARLWHRRLGHLHYKGLHHLSKGHTAEGIPYLPQLNDTCHRCQLGKQSRESFPKQSDSRATEPLQLIHSDLCGPFSIPTKSGEPPAPTVPAVTTTAHQDEPTDVRLDNSDVTEGLPATDTHGELSPPKSVTNNTPQEVIVTNVRRSGRVTKRPSRLNDFALALDEEEPLTFADASQHPHWVEAMDREMDSIRRNSTWELIPCPPGKRPITARWLYKLKEGIDGTPNTYKAQLVARGYEQRAGTDYEETFAPVVKWTTLRALISLAAKNDWQL
ncbi:hypothetical protein R1sor_004057 [Riccia sorocarpa]|uniref:CCHC-type domain-containing protein n=1 Tax=Riccia sorocarpa TaxID=122646 RepID=A0ABD3H6R1_9MARC